MKKIPLTKGMFALVDDDDYEELSTLKWNASPTKAGYFYTARSEKNEHGKYRTVFMHRAVNKTPKGVFTDHKNGDTLDNRKENLRDATRSQNRQNSAPTKGKKYSELKGAFYHKRDKVWLSRVVMNGRALDLGRYKTAQLAAAAYKDAAKRYFGEFYREGGQV